MALQRPDVAGADLYGAGFFFAAVAQTPQVPPEVHHLHAEQLLQAVQGVRPVRRAAGPGLCPGV